MKALIKEQQLEEGIHAKEEYQHGLEVDVKIYNQESYGEEKHPHGEERQEIGVVRVQSSRNKSRRRYWRRPGESYRAIQN